jgi:hypothetical protein
MPLGCCCVVLPQGPIREGASFSREREGICHLFAAQGQGISSEDLRFLSAVKKNPQAMRLRRETAEHPFATLRMRMGATHFLMKRLPKVATEIQY